MVLLLILKCQWAAGGNLLAFIWLAIDLDTTHSLEKIFTAGEKGICDSFNNLHL